MTKKIVIVSGGTSRGAPKYKLLKEIFQGTSTWYPHYSTRAEWRVLLDRIYRQHASGLTFRSYSGASLADRSVYYYANGDIKIGCNTFRRGAVRKIAKWAGWSSYWIKLYLPVIKKQKKA